MAIDSSEGVAEPEQADGAAEFGAVDRHVAPVVARRLVLLVGRLVLLVDDDEAQVAHRREDGRAGADHHPRLAGGQRQPAVEPLALAEVAVPDDDLVVGGDGLQASVQARHGLGRERDLGHEVDHAAARGQRLATARR